MLNSPCKTLPLSQQDNCNIFVNNIQQLNAVVEKYISSIDTQVAARKGHARGSRLAFIHHQRDYPFMQVERIEREKLRAVGLRNRVAALEEVRRSTLSSNVNVSPLVMPAQERRRKQKDQERLLAERQEELERLQMEELSLSKVMQEQQQLIAKLSDSSSGAAFS